jgi:hypothetical protein
MRSPKREKRGEGEPGKKDIHEERDKYEVDYCGNRKANVA